MMRVATYARVSTTDQAREGFSLAAQTERLLSYARSRDWAAVRQYVDDGHSGRNIDRPAYTRMMQEMDSWDVVLVAKMDRIHRNSRNFADMMDTLRRRGKDFASINESLDTSTAMGRFVMDIIQRIAQLESEQIGERVYAGMEQKAREGKPPGGEAPYGYRRVGGTLSVDPDEAVVVLRVRELRAVGMTPGRIAKRLDSEGVRPRRAEKWSRQLVHKILVNPIHEKRVRWGGVEVMGEHEVIQ